MTVEKNECQWHIHDNQSAEEMLVVMKKIKNCLYRMYIKFIIKIDKSVKKTLSVTKNSAM